MFKDLVDDLKDFLALTTFLFSTIFLVIYIFS